MVSTWHLKINLLIGWLVKLIALSWICQKNLYIVSRHAAKNLIQTLCNFLT